MTNKNVKSILWKVNCMENSFPGMWQRWLQHQAVGIGWPPQDGHKLIGNTRKNYGWSKTRKNLQKMQPGDFIIVALGNHRVGRIGEIVSKEVQDDEWNPLVEPKVHPPHGEMGRRVNVRWDFESAPMDREIVVELPHDKRFTKGEQRGTISKIESITLQTLRDLMADESNWIGLLGKFRYEKALSNFIAAYPHRLEDGLLPHPDMKIREKVLKDRSRLDILLVDKNNNPVVVECKQNAPSKSSIKQLRHYMEALQRESKYKIKPRGMIVHGGARKLNPEVSQYSEKKPKVEIIQYKLDLEFTPSY